jgi:hypothetical protein
LYSFTRRERRRAVAEDRQLASGPDLQSYIPTTSFFDDSSVYLTTQADLTIQKSARLSFDFGGIISR